MRKAQFFYLLRRGLLSGGLNLITEGLVMASKFITQGLSFPAQGSAEFDGSSDYIQLNDPFSYTNHTIAAWVYAEDNASNKEIFDNRNASSKGFLFRVKSDEKVFYRLDTATGLETSISYIENWVYAVGTYDGTTQKLYINGSLEDSQSLNKTISTEQNAIIGKYTQTDSNYFNGNLANVAMWNRALSSDEINSVMWKSYEALSGAESNGLQAWYSLDDISGSSVPDSSGNGNNGTAY